MTATKSTSVATATGNSARSATDGPARATTSSTAPAITSGPRLLSPVAATRPEDSDRGTVPMLPIRPAKICAAPYITVAARKSTRGDSCIAAPTASMLAYTLTSGISIVSTTNTTSTGSAHASGLDSGATWELVPATVKAIVPTASRYSANPATYPTRKISARSTGGPT